MTQRYPTALARSLRSAAAALLLLFAGSAMAQLAVTPITWDIVGLDSNRPITSGPELFPVGARVCAGPAGSSGPVSTSLVWDTPDPHPFINTRPGSRGTLAFGTLGPNACVDAYFEIRLTRAANAFGQSRPYRVVATDGSGSYQTPTPRAIYIERLVSQNRNSTQQIRYGQQANQSDWVVLGAGGSINLAVGNTYFIELTTQTATAYEELQSFLTLSNTIFQILSVSTTYGNLTAPPSRVPTPNPRLWADGCLWESDTGSPNWRSCLSTGKAGGLVTTVYEIAIISGGGDSIGLEALIYDFSGGSFHYNTDFSRSPGDMTSFDPADSGFTKRFLPATIAPGGTSRLVFTIVNPNPVALSGYSFVDNLPAGVQVAAAPNPTSTCGGIWAPAAGDTVLAFDIGSGQVGANGSCSIAVNVTAAALGSYLNVSENLFFEGQDTGNNATATLNVANATPAPCVPGTEIARWSMAPAQGTAVPPAFFSKHPSVATALASFTGSALPGVQSINTTLGNPANSWSGTGWGVATTPATAGPDANTPSYFEFELDTSAFSTDPAQPMAVSLQANPTPNGDWATEGNITLNVHVSRDGGPFTTVINQNGISRQTWNTLSNAAITPGLGSTRFRVNVTGRSTGGGGPNATLLLDNIVFTGCGPGAPGTVPAPPNLSKQFSPGTIGLGQVSTLSFQIANPNPASALSGIAFSDTLPPGVAVANPPGAVNSGCGGSWAPVAGAGALSFTGGALAGGASCTLSVQVTSASVGTHLNISDAITATQSGQNTGPNGYAEATLTVLATPTIGKNFDPELVLIGVTPGNRSTLTFQVVNPNLSAGISGVAFGDVFPAPIVVATPPNATVGAGCLAGSFTAMAGAGSVSFSGGSIGPGGTCVLSVDVTGPAGVYNNVSTPVSHIVGGTTVSGNTAADTLTIDHPIPLVAISKTVGLGNHPDGTWVNFLALEVPTQVFYRLVVENTGELPLTGLTVNDPDVSTAGCVWPSPLPVADVLNPTAHIAECIIGPVNANAPGVFPNTATANATGGVTPVSDSDSAVYASAALTLDKTASPTTFTAAGEVIAYTFTVTNSGAAILPGPVTIDDPLVPAASCPALSTIGNNDNFFDPGEVIVCSGSYLTAAGDVLAGFVTNTATAGAGGFASPSDSATVTLAGAALTITKTASASPWTVGVPASYTLTVENTGAAATTAVSTITDTIPTGLTIGTLPAGCTAADQTVTCTIPAGLAAGGSVSFVIPVTPTLAATPSVTNTATVSGGGAPACPADPRCSSTAGPTPVNAPQLTITKTASASPWTVGVPASYTLTIENTGTAATTAVSTITDTIPTGLTIGTLPAGCTAADQTVTCTIPAGLAASGSVSFVIPVTPTLAAMPSVTNTATVSGGGDPTCPADPRCSSTAGPTPVNAPQLTITKTASASPWTVGVPASYTLTVQNTGTAATTAVSTITDTIPTGLTIGTLPAGCTSLGQTVTCTTPAGLAAGGSAGYVIPVTPTLAATPSVTNTATVSGGGDPACPADPRCSSTAGPTPVNAPQLTITKTASASPWTVGVPASYILTVENTGTAATTAVSTITDTIPVGLTIGTLPAGCTSLGQAVTCTIPAGLAAGGSAGYVIPVTPTLAATPSVTNTATVSGGGDPTCPADPRCSGTAGPTPVNAPQLSVDKSAPAAAVVGVAFDYVLTVTNSGSAATTAPATVTDVIPAGLTINAAPGCGVAGQVVTCTIAAGLSHIAPGNTASFTINVTPTAAAANPILNSASVVGGGDPNCANPGDCTDGTSTPLDSPSLSIDKSAPAAATLNVAFDYVLTVTNSGSAATTAPATVTDVIPAGLTINSAPGCGIAVQTVTCTVPAGLSPIAPGNTASFTINVTPTAAAANPILNSASVVGGGDPNCANPGDCTDGTSTPLDSPSLSIDKSAPAAAVVGVAFDYVLTVTNSGSAATTAPATVTDVIPAGLTINSAPGCGIAVQTVTCTVPAGLSPIAPGNTASFTINVTPTAAAANPILNSASVVGGGDPNCANPGDCTDGTSTPLTPPSVVVGKSSDPADGSPVLPNDTIAYTVTAVVSDAPLSSDLVLEDTLGVGLSFVSVTNAVGFTANTAGNPLVFTLASGTAPGSYSIEYTATVDAGATGNVGNSVVIETDGGDPTPTCPSCSTSHPVVTELAVFKSVESFTPLGPGRFRVAYRLEVVNGAGATAYTLLDTLGFVATGVQFDGPAVVSSADGAVNPSLPSGQYVPVNGAAQQISDDDVPLGFGESHTYLVELRVTVDGDALTDGQCTGAPGNGLFNAASLAGVAGSESTACQSLQDGRAAIALTKRVELAVDFNRNNLGDVGDVLGYAFEIRNVGSQPLSVVHLLDERVADLSCDAQTLSSQPLTVLLNAQIFSSGFSGLGTLAPGDAILCWATHTLGADDVARRRVTNTATASGRGLSGEVVRSTATAIFGSFQ